jgi:hypothetical protein
VVASLPGARADGEQTCAGRLRDGSGARGRSRLLCRRTPRDAWLLPHEREAWHVARRAARPCPLRQSVVPTDNNVFHDSLPVAQFNEKLLKSVERHLIRFPPHEPFERTSWEIADDRNLFRHAIADLGPDEPVDPRIAPEDLWLRLDTQTLRKLPRTRGIVFGVHPVMARFSDFADAPLVPALLERVHREADPVLMQVCDDRFILT